VDRTGRSILLSLIIALVLAVLAILAALWIPFDVDQPAAIQNVSTSAELITPDNPPVSLTSARPRDHPALKTGQGVRVEPGSSATILFFERGRAVLTGPAVLTLVAAHRHATALGHIFDSGRFTRDYVLTLSQQSGSIRYDFSRTSPPFADISITIELPDRSYSPTTPCWMVDISAGGQSTAGPADCP
jgi:hypothetical protein